MAAEPATAVEREEFLERSREERRVFHWRRDQFEALGFEPLNAAILATGDADLGRARAMAAAGCSLSLIAKVLV